MIPIDTQFILALVIAGSIGAVAGFLGTLMLTKRMTLVGGPLGHLTLPGIALALLYGFDVFLGALIFVLIGISFIWYFGKKTKLPMEALTAIVFPFSMATAFLFLPEEETVQALIGDISQISLFAVITTISLSLITFLVIKRIYKKMVFIGISEDLAKVKGIDIQKYNLIYLICIALVVAISVRIVGGLMTVAIMAIPASTSRNLSKNLSQYAYGGLVFGVLASILGVFVFKLVNIPVGPAIIIVSVIFFLISFILRSIRNVQI
jgi:ABC-type Mn2+/Zn2+ transport system permease subunit